ncbi:MAG: UPF0175 family protein [Phycisphaerales bacterium]|nr:UPF0175 family protein [Phycisphaerales bacterium]
MTIHLQIPDDAAAALRRAWGDNLDRAALEALVMEGYRAGKLGIGTVRRLLGFDSRYETEEWLGSRGVHWNYGLDDLEADRRTLDRVFGDRHS